MISIFLFILVVKLPPVRARIDVSDAAKLHDNLMERQRQKLLRRISPTHRPTAAPSYKPYGYLRFSGDEIKIYNNSNNAMCNCTGEAMDMAIDFARKFNEGRADATVLSRIELLERTSNLSFGFLGRDEEKCSSDEMKLKAPCSNQLYDVLWNKWLYLYGDSTMRQLWESFFNPFHHDGSEWYHKYVKEYFRTQCPRQIEHRKPFDGECIINEHTCNMHGYGSNGLITMDWKHLILEDYDRWLLEADNVFDIDHSPFSPNLGPNVRRPDYLIVNIVLHSCYHHYDGKQEPFTANFEMGQEENIFNFMRLVKVATNRPGFQKTHVIILTSGRVFHKKNLFAGKQMDLCILHLNKVVVSAALSVGLNVYDRDLVEQTLLQIAENASAPVLEPDLHLPQPAPRITATALAAMLACMVQEDNRRNGKE